MFRSRALLIPSPTVYGQLSANSFWSKLVGAMRLNMAIVSLISCACSKDCVHRSHLDCLCLIQSTKVLHWAGFLTFSHTISWISHGFLSIFPTLHSLFYWAVTWLSLYPRDFSAGKKIKRKNALWATRMLQGAQKRSGLDWLIQICFKWAKIPLTDVNYLN